MKKKNFILTLCLGSNLLAFPLLSPAGTPTGDCDRHCLKAIALQVLTSMKEHNSESLPLARSYLLTENGTPVSPVMSTLWRTVTDFKPLGPGQEAIDPATGQIVVITEVREGDSPSVFYGRLKVEDRHLTELELYISRSKGESGQLFAPHELDNLPQAWRYEVPAKDKAGREELTRVAYSVFDKSYGNPPGSKSCELVEMGGRVIEDPDALKLITQADAPDLSHRATEGGVSVPCTVSDRPEDKQARVVVDVQQGVAASFGIVPGVVFPSFITPGLESTFVPADSSAGWKRLPADIHDPNGTPRQSRHKHGDLPYVPVLKTMPASMQTVEVVKFYGGKIEGVQRYMHMQSVGSGSVWNIDTTGK
ncbi:hypothetical protein [Brenneria nigrifluens]|uniref:Uncharacterized protein n=1 Tax=Brenneria nigrifluens DSM 30175 = ATCC 13028 TaxID=1121120 RepID=A0A2U1UQV7_9GAMM|nr:hypothetical protein [Brenneria nigrifluens]PWC24053.1 hypothetical protein DDT54_10865 [Brenneria nigrifluens DSM 30175 = ATCC 13028]QCR05246.1 hypothetical protein EH206_14260 [Brenneria nigrifluens DSM 30175 = ATCC 13028]